MIITKIQNSQHFEKLIRGIAKLKETLLFSAFSVPRLYGFYFTGYIELCIGNIDIGKKSKISSKYRIERKSWYRPSLKTMQVLTLAVASKVDYYVAV